MDTSKLTGFETTLDAAPARVTMKDIAAKLDVSINTVHKALTDKPGVGKAMRAKILKTAEDMGYQRNANASNLRRKVLKVFVCLPSAKRTGSYFFAYLWKGVREYAYEALDMGISFEAKEYALAQYEDELSSFAARVEAGEHFDGLITIAPRTAGTTALVKSLAEAGVKVMLLDGDTPESGRLAATIPNYDAAGCLMAEQAMNLLAGTKDARVLMLAGDQYSDSHYLVARAFHRSLQEAQANIEVTDLNGAHEQFDQLHRELTQLLQSGRKPSLICSVFAVGTELIADTLVELGMAGQVKAIGSDLFPESVLALKKGIFTNLVYKNPVGLAYRAASTLGECLLQGKLPAEATELGQVQLVFKSNVDQYAQVAGLD